MSSSTCKETGIHTLSALLLRSGELPKNKSCLRTVSALRRKHFLTPSYTVSIIEKAEFRKDELLKSFGYFITIPRLKNKQIVSPYFNFWKSVSARSTVHKTFTINCHVARYC